MNGFPKNTSHSSAKKIDKYHYNLHDIIGQGSFATVYLGKDTELDELRAIKVLNTSSLQKDKDEALKISILNEIKILKSLENPNVIKCHDVLSTPNNTYLIMDYCDGGDLKSYLKKHMRLSEDNALKILKQILNGYKELFKNGVIHRDLKTDNILIKNDVFMLGDFGFAKILNNFEKDVLKSLVGTPLYMSPQILKQEDYTSKSDIWSIGIIYYELLFGKTPWESISDTDLVKKIMSGKVEFPAGIIISALSKKFIEGCLKFDENERLSWGEVYSHELFGDCFDYRRKRTIFETKANKIGAKLGNIVKTKNVDVFKLFKSIDNNKNGKLEIDEFARLMSKIDETLKREEIEYIFNKVDNDHSNYIDFDEFQKWLTSEEKNDSNTRSPPIKQDPFQIALSNIQFVLKKKMLLLGESLRKNERKKFRKAEFLLFFKEIDSNLEESDLVEIFKRISGADKCLDLENFLNLLKDEKFIKHRISESQSPLIPQLAAKKFGPKTQSFHSSSLNVNQSSTMSSKFGSIAAFNYNFDKKV